MAQEFNGVCPECGNPFNFANPATYTFRVPFVRWKFWLPSALLGAGGALVLIVTLATRASTRRGAS